MPDIVLGPEDRAVNKATIPDGVRFCLTWGIPMLNKTKKSDVDNIRFIRAPRRKLWQSWRRGSLRGLGRERNIEKLVEGQGRPPLGMRRLSQDLKEVREGAM